MHHMKQFLFPAAIFAAALVTFALAAPVAPPSVYDVGATGDEHIALGFLQPEVNPEGSYRWTDGDSTLRFWGYEIAELPLAGVAITAPAGAQGTATLWLESAEGPLAGIRPPPGRRVYSVLLPSPSRWRSPELRLRSTTFQPRENDGRQLGVVVHDATIRALGGARIAPRVERAAFLALLVALVYAAVGVFARPRYALAVALALLALLVAATLLDLAGTTRRLPPVWTLIGALVGGVALLWATGWLRGRIMDAGRWGAVGTLVGLGGQALLRERVLLLPGGLLLL
ncbi:MAG TPA: hypothetical protein VLA19_19755, partial [Herpetosiphonaceae bacterium]|nr:hypothetical protein [Herpetosiphonaceae bacterium]